ncbi:hypothetical protein HY449_01550 [Candidatus Pacearchaeota archaeon]|nr:hypothetical protein [Candidatus Pacearchaeota archaeon]
MKKFNFKKIKSSVIFAIFFALILTGMSFVKSETDIYPANGSIAEQGNWITNNPDKFNPNDESQKKAFAKAYSDNKIDLNNVKQREAVEKYLTRYQERVSFEDRKMLNELVSYHARDVKVFLDKGEDINLIKEGDKLFIISSDGEKHDFVSYSSYQIGGKKLDKITSREDGTIELGFGENSIALKDTTLFRDEFGKFLLADGSVLDFGNNFGKILFDGNGINCASKLCSFSVGKMGVELNSLGTFQILGDDRFSVVDGTAKIGDNLLAGSYEFSTKSGNSELNFDNRIELRKFSGQSGMNKESYVRVREGEFGNVDVNTGSAERKVVACFGCNDLTKSAGYDGSVNFKKDSAECATGDCKNAFKADIADKIIVKFENDAIHQGFDKLKASYNNLGYDVNNNPQAFFRLEGCDGCKVGEGQIAGIQVINGNWFSIENENYDSNNAIPQLRYKYIHTASRFVPYYKYTIANDEGITFSDNDLYRSSMSEDFLRTGKFKSTQLLERDFGSKSIKKYMEEYYTIHSSGNPVEVEIKTSRLTSEMKSTQQYSRQIYVVDDTAFNLDSNGNVVYLPNLYVMNKGGSFAIDQLKTLNEYNQFFNIEDNTLPNFFNRQQKACSAIVDAHRGIFEENQKASAFLRNLLSTFPIENAQQCLGSYGERAAGAAQMEEMFNSGMNLGQIYQKSLTDNLVKVKETFNEPSVLLELNKEEINRAIANKENIARIYKYSEDGRILRDNIDINIAEREVISNAVGAYLRKDRNYVYDPLLAERIQTSYITNKLSSFEDRKNFLKFVDDLQNGKDGAIFSSGESALPENYVIGKSGVVEIKNPYIAKMISDGKITKEEIAKLSDLDSTFKGDEFNQDFRLVLETIAPKSAGELAINVVPNLGALGKSFVVLSKAEGIVSTINAVGVLGLRGASAGLLGFAGASGVSKFDDALIALRTSGIKPVTGIELASSEKYLSSLAGHVAEDMGFAPGEVQVVGFSRRLFSEGKDVVAFTHKDPATGEVTPLLEGIFYTNKDQATNAIRSLNKLDELGIGKNYQFAGAYSYPFGNAEGTMVFRTIPQDVLSSGNPDAAFEAFKESVNHLPDSERVAAIEAYNACCRVTRIPASATDVFPPVAIGSGDAAVLNNKFTILEGNSRISVTDPQTNKRIGTLSYGVDKNNPNHIVTISTEVSPDFRGQGVQDLMFKELLFRNNFNKITTSLIETNEEVFTQTFIDKISSRYKISSFSKDDLPGVKLSECCSEVMKTIPQEEIDALVKESLQNTPAYRSRKKFGFEICDKKFKFSGDANSLEVGFTACR